MITNPQIACGLPCLGTACSCVQGRLTSLADPRGGVTRFTYDGNGNLLAVTDALNHTYDAASRLRAITQAPLNPVDIQYDAFGRRTTLTLPNGVSTGYQYDTSSRLTTLIYRNATGLLGGPHLHLRCDRQPHRRGRLLRPPAHPRSRGVCIV